MNVVVVGCGYWGSNLARSLVETNRSEQIFYCDLSRTALAKVVRRFPNVWLARTGKLTLVRDPSLLQTMTIHKRTSPRLLPPAIFCARDHRPHRPNQHTERH